MSNQYFQFKQFRIDQEHCAMKVTTDACIQGAWTPLQPQVKRILDIGAGTGLLSLMLAQRAPDAAIDAIEYDSAAAAQARDNVAASPWHARVNIIEGDVCDHAFVHKYDLIISNPPFFNNSLLGSKEEKNRARHTISLTYERLLHVINDNLAVGGYGSILLPYPEYLQWKKLIEDNSYDESGSLSVRHAPNATVKRVVSLCSKATTSISNDMLTIKEDDGKYTAGFTALLAPFYLDL